MRLSAFSRHDMTARQSQRSVGLVLPLGLFFAVFVFVPLALLAYVSLHGTGNASTLGLAQYRKFFFDAFNLGILGATLLLAAKATLLALLVGYPLAYLYTLA
jgi:putative spermidine/putrescine transport system permease protein